MSYPSTGAAEFTINSPDESLYLLATFYSKSRPQDNTPPAPGYKPVPLTPIQQAVSQSFPGILPSLFINPDRVPKDSIIVQAYTPYISQLFLPFPTPSPPGSFSVNSPSNVRRTLLFRTIENTENLEIILDLFSLPTPPAPFSKIPSRPVGLGLFDMDSTLINEEVIDELAASLGPQVSSAVSAITARAMNGEIDFATSLRERVGMLKGVRADVWEEELIKKGKVTIAEGARELILGLKERGVITGVVSGGFVPMAEWLKGELGLDWAGANTLLTSPPTSQYPYPHLTGSLSPSHPIVTPEYKRSTLLSLASEHGIPLSQTLAVGDGSNDLLMLDAAGLGVAWNAKPRVQEAAPMRLNGGSLADLLLHLGPPLG